ncbi:MAG: outer membrane protein assembly factor BamE [Agarilytica sp.]
MQFISKISAILLILSISACSSLKFPGVYRIAVQQGNYIEQKMVDQLEVGMSKRQVKFVLGTPMVEDTFNLDRWDYYYSVKRGDKIIDNNHFTVFFENDSLARWEGDYILNAEQQEQEKKDALDTTRKSEEAKF